MSGLLPAVVLCSETQERFMWVVPPELAEMILKHYNETFALPQVSEGARACGDRQNSHRWFVCSELPR